MLRLRAGTARLHRRGGAAVELALVSPVLLFLVLGTAELGVMFAKVAQLNNATRAGTRLAATGALTTAVRAAVIAAVPNLNSANLTQYLEYRTCTSGTWSAWTTLTDSASNNAAPTGAQVRVRADYKHYIMIGGLFGFIADNTQTKLKTLHASAVSRRE